MPHIKCSSSPGDVAMSAKAEVSRILTKRKPYPQTWVRSGPRPTRRFLERERILSSRGCKKRSLEDRWLEILTAASLVSQISLCGGLATKTNRNLHPAHL